MIMKKILKIALGIVGVIVVFYAAVLITAWV